MKEQEQQAEALDYFLSGSDDCLQNRKTGILRAVPGPYLKHFKQEQLLYSQSYKPLADEMSRQGYRPLEAIDSQLGRVVIFATKHREEVLSQLADALLAVEEGTSIVLTAANDLGAQSLQRRCEEVAGGVDVLSKHKCRVIYFKRRSMHLNVELLERWAETGKLQLRSDTGLYSCPGIFSWKRIDVGSRLLAEQLPKDLAGYGADLGAGAGYLSREALLGSPGILGLTLVEVEQKALKAAQLNLATWKDRVHLGFQWRDLTQDFDLNELDFVIMNPPFHEGRGLDVDLGRRFIWLALRALKMGGRLFMVANRHLPYETELESVGGRLDHVVFAEGFKFMAVTKISGGC